MSDKKSSLILSYVTNDEDQLSGEINKQFVVKNLGVFPETYKENIFVDITKCEEEEDQDCDSN